MMGEQKDRRSEEIAALRAGIELGMRLIDTAEMYGDGASEMLIGEAIAGLREEVFLVSKAYPQNASAKRLPNSCEASLQRLGTDRLDLYLLHWRSNVPLAETVEAMQTLQRQGKIRHWGVSNLDTDDMEELVAAGGGGCVTDQILYNLTRRGPEHDLLAWLGSNRMTAMAYSPVEQGRLLDNSQLVSLAADLSVTPAQLSLAWVLRRRGTIAIPNGIDHSARAGKRESRRNRTGCCHSRRARRDLSGAPHAPALGDAVAMARRERTAFERQPRDD